ncbi:MAG: MBL fold metallo-hydrolase [Methanomicrobiales archaeon]|nr:MBL fold metallo-hydrolase [Methanomicrobiales archaeon]
MSPVKPRVRTVRSVYSFLPALLLLACIVVAGCAFHGISSHAGTNVIPPSYGLNDGRLVVHFIDVGQGDSALIQYNGTTILIDAGEADEGPGLITYLKHQGVRNIDILVATHPHSDHIGGMQEVLKNFDVLSVIDSGMPYTTTTYQKFLETIDRKNIPYSTVQRGDSFSPAPGLTMLVLSAPDGSKDQDPNDGSIVLRASIGRMNILFEGDAGITTEELMVNSGLPLESQVLKVAHHGSPHGTGRAFLERVRPEAAIISVGAGNPYYHPAGDTLRRLEDSGALIFRTDTDGSTVVRTDGMKFSIETAKNGMYPFVDSIPTSAPA